MTPMLFAYIIKLITNQLAKQTLVARFLKGWDENSSESRHNILLKKIGNITQPKAMEKIKWHQKQGHKVIIVSASMECWLKPWCVKTNIDLMATRLEIIEGQLTGRFATKNCYGIEKVNRIKAQYNLSEYDVIYAYGDSLGDK